MSTKEEDLKHAVWTIRSIIADDAFAASHQSLGQYRTALLTGIAKVMGEILLGEPTWHPALQALQQECDELRTQVEALTKPQEPVMVYHGGCTIDCGEHGHHNMEMLKLIPAGTKLYAHPTPSPLTRPASFPERDTTKPAEQQGLFRKFTVSRVDGGDAPGGKHHGCEYFVLDMDHDKAAPAALVAYADAVAETHPQLASDLRARFGKSLTRPAVPEGWKHDCAALLLNDVELWIDACPHCGKPRPALAAAPQPPVEVARPAVPEATGIEKIMLVVDAYAEVWAAAQDPTSDDAFGHLEAQRKALEEAITRFAAPQPEAQPTEAVQPTDNPSEDYKQGWMDGMSEATRLSAPVVTAKDALGLLAIEDDAIVLRLTADAAASSFANDPKAQTERPAVTDKQQFLRDVFNALSSEREDGSTRLTDVLDWAEREAWEQGSLGLAAQKGGV